MHPRELREESYNPSWQTIWEYLCHGEMVDQRPFQPTMEHQHQLGLKCSIRSE